MDIANLTRYTIDYVPDSCDGDYVQHNVSKDGEYVKFEEAMEAYSNSLRQLKAEILRLIMDDNYACSWQTLGQYRSGLVKEIAKLRPFIIIGV
jgi:hypothetical protein